MKIKQPAKHVLLRIEKWQLDKKWQKAVYLLATNPGHPSLHVELLEPKHQGIYSFRLDRKYRALYFIDNGEVEVFQITKHYRK